MTTGEWIFVAVLGVFGVIWIILGVLFYREHRRFQAVWSDFDEAIARIESFRR